MEAKKYNSLLTLSAPIDHALEEGEDITLEMVRKAFHQRLCDIDEEDLFILETLEDTYEY